MAKSLKVPSPGKKAMMNESKYDESRGKKQVLKVNGRKEKPLPDLEHFNTGMPKKKAKDKKKKLGKSNVPHAY